jgi:hypothetical protein
MKRILSSSFIIAGCLLYQAAGCTQTIQQAVGHCNNNDYLTCAQLGVKYFTGDGVNRSFPTSAKYFQKACDGGILDACSFGADAYVQSAKATPSKADFYIRNAIKSYTKACNKNVGMACLGLGDLYSKIPSIKDYGKAFRYFEKSCSLGDEVGCMEIGFAYENGQGTLQSPTEAIKYYQQSCKAGFGLACGAAASLYLSGKLGFVSVFKAVEYGTKGCEQNDQVSCGNLGIAYSKDNRTLQQAKAAFKKACDLGNDYSCGQYQQLGGR